MHTSPMSRLRQRNRSSDGGPTIQVDLRDHTTSNPFEPGDATRRPAPTQDAPGWREVKPFSRRRHGGDLYAAAASTTFPAVPMIAASVAIIFASAPMIYPDVPTTGNRALLIFPTPAMIVRAVGMMFPGAAMMDFGVPQTLPAPSKQASTPDLKRTVLAITRSASGTTRFALVPTRKLTFPTGKAAIPTGKTVSRVVAAPPQVGNQALAADTDNRKSVLEPCPTHSARPIKDAGITWLEIYMVSSSA
jgi:hypothetical protein